MNKESLFNMEMIDGAVKVMPSKELASLPVDEQIARLEKELRACEAELKAMDDTAEGQAEGKDLNSAKCETELTILVLKNFLKQFREANWVRMNE